MDFVLNLRPALDDVTASFENLAGAKQNLAKGLRKTPNCGKSGPSDSLRNVEKGNENSARHITLLAETLAEQTSDAGQLALVTGEPNKLTDSFYDVAKALNSFSDDIQTLADNIDNQSLNGVGKVASAVEHVADSLAQFTGAFSHVKGPSNLLVKLSTALTGFDTGVKDLSASFKAVMEAASDKQKSCRVDTGVPEALSDVIKQADIISENLEILNLNLSNLL